MEKKEEQKEELIEQENKINIPIESYDPHITLKYPKINNIINK